MGTKYKVIMYITSSKNCPVRNYIAELVKNNSEKDLSVIKLYISGLEEYGLRLTDVYSNSIKHLRGKIYELRPGNHRITFSIIDDEYILLHAFRKTTNKTPNRMIDISDDRYKDYERRKTR